MRGGRQFIPYVRVFPTGLVAAAGFGQMSVALWQGFPEQHLESA